VLLRGWDVRFVGPTAAVHAESEPHCCGTCGEWASLLRYIPRVRGLTGVNGVRHGDACERLTDVRGWAGTGGQRGRQPSVERLDEAALSGPEQMNELTAF
jgi:hypothetical protein